MRSPRLASFAFIVLSLADAITAVLMKAALETLETDPEVAETEPASVSEGSSKISELFLDESKVAETETTS
ncbi:hypothetical protein GGH98_003380, partial [Coemansia sp. RSA 454]